MSTKTEWFAYYAQRQHSPKEEHAGEHAPAARGAGPTHREKKATYAREESAGQPSRKSTRKSANRQKTDVQFRLKAREREGVARPPP